MTAYDFHNPEATDFYPDVYRTRGFVFNTYPRRPARPPVQFQKGDAKYAEFIVRQLVQHGSAAVDEIIADMTHAGAVTAADLELIVKAHGLTASVLDPHFTFTPDLARMDPLSAAYVRRRLSAEVGRAAPELLSALAETSNFLPLLDLVGAAGPSSEPSSGSSSGPVNPVVRLFQVMPNSESTRNAMLALPNLLPEYKAQWLEAFIRKTGAWPRKYPNLWTSSAFRSGGTIQALVERLPPELAAKVTESLPASRLGAFVSLLGVAAAKDPGKRGLLATLVRDLDDDAFCTVLAGPEPQARQFLQSFAPNDHEITAKLVKLLKEVTKRPESFRERLAALSVGQSRLPQRDRETLGVWIRLRDAIVELAESAEPKKSLLGRSTTSEELAVAGTRLGQAIVEALPERECIINRGSPRQLRLIKAMGGSLLDPTVAGTFWLRARRLLMPAAIAVFTRDYSLCLFLASEEAPEWIEHYPRDEPALGERLAKIMDELPDVANEFEIRLSALLAAQNVSPGAAGRIKSCGRVYDCLLRIRKMREQVEHPSELRGTDLEQLAKSLAMAIGGAFTNKIYYDPKMGKIVNKGLMNDLGEFVIGDDTLSSCKQLWPMIQHNLRTIQSY